MNYKGIVFDKDGTLLDFNQTWFPVYHFAALEVAEQNETIANRLLANHGYNFTTRQFIGGSLLAAGNNDETAEAWAKELNKKDQAEFLSRQLHETFQHQGSLSATAVKELKPSLEKLKSAGLKLGIATADSHAGIIHTLSAFEVLPLFDYLAGFDSGNGIKPEGKMVRTFCAQNNIKNEETIVVGDNRHDIEMGRNASAGLCVGVLTGTSTRTELEKIADVVLNDISELPEYLKI